MEQPNVIIYSTNTCPYCVYAKDFFDHLKIPYIDKNVQSDRGAAIEMVEKTGQMGVPVVQIHDQVFVGFRPDEFLTALNITV